MKQLFIVIFLFYFGSNSFAQNLDRSKVEEKYKWNLAEVYPSVEAWQTAVNNISTKIDKLPDYKGKLGSNAETLYDALKTFFDVLKCLYSTGSYASNLSNENLNISENQSLDQQITSIGTKFSENTAFLEPEILSIPKEKIDQFFQRQTRTFRIQHLY